MFIVGCICLHSVASLMFCYDSAVLPNSWNFTYSVPVDVSHGLFSGYSILFQVWYRKIPYYSRSRNSNVSRFVFLFSSRTEVPILAALKSSEKQIILVFANEVLVGCKYRTFYSEFERDVNLMSSIQDCCCLLG